MLWVLKKISLLFSSRDREMMGGRLESMWEREVGWNGEGRRGSQGAALPSCLFFHLEYWQRGIPQLVAGSLVQTQLFTLIKPAVLNLCVGSGSASLLFHEAVECSG